MIWKARPRSEAPGGLAWVRTGSGAPVVLLHGVGLRAEAWGAQVDALAATYAVHLLDLPGHGESTRLTGEPALADFTDRIATAVAAIELPALVAGHSMGALIALDLAIRYPRLCSGIAVLNAVHDRSPDASAAVRARAAAMPLDAPADPAPTLRRWFGDEQATPAARACRGWLLGADPMGYKTAYTAFAHADGPPDEALAGLTRPALFATGTEEPNATPAMSRAMASRAPGGQVLIVEGAAHMMPMTHAPEVNAALLAFFQRCDGGAP